MPTEPKRDGYEVLRNEATDVTASSAGEGLSCDRAPEEKEEAAEEEEQEEEMAPAIASRSLCRHEEDEKDAEQCGSARSSSRPVQQPVVPEQRNWNRCLVVSLMMIGVFCSSLAVVALKWPHSRTQERVLARLAAVENASLEMSGDTQLLRDFPRGWEKDVKKAFGEAANETGFLARQARKEVAFIVGEGTVEVESLMGQKHKREAAQGLCAMLNVSRIEDKEGYLLPPDEYKEQERAQIDACGTVKVYAVGSSNIVWMTWLDQLHLYLKRLGYVVPYLPIRVEGDPRRLQTCDDTRYFDHLKTAHLGKVGWASWDFAFDDWDDCNEDGFRQIGGHDVKCGHGIGCEHGRDPLLRLSDIAADAALSDVTLVTTWFNDHKQPLTHPPFKCFNGENIQQANTSLIVIPNILKLVRAIRALNNETWVVVVAEYPMTSNLQVMDSSVQWVHELNKRVKAALADEPRTLFVDYDMPAQGLEMYQTANYGHPNCRGSKIMAHGILEALYGAGILARSLRLESPLVAAGPGGCGNLTGAACHSSALCWVDPVDEECKPYSVGSKDWYVKQI